MAVRRVTLTGEGPESRGWGMRTECQDCVSDPDPVGYHDHSHGHGPYDHPYEESNRGCSVWGKEFAHGVLEIGHLHGGHDRDRTQSAMKQRGECEPTKREKDDINIKSSTIKRRTNETAENLPRSSGYHHARCACYASHSRHRRHPACLHTPQTQSFRRHVSSVQSLRDIMGETYSLLDAERGAGMSQRTSRP